MQQCESTWRISFHLKRSHKLTNIQSQSHTSIRYRWHSHTALLQDHSMHSQFRLHFSIERSLSHSFSLSLSFHLSAFIRKKEIAWETKQNVFKHMNQIRTQKPLCWCGNETKIWCLGINKWRKLNTFSNLSVSCAVKIFPLQSSA